jgi:hypothetical protein
MSHLQEPVAATEGTADAEDTIGFLRVPERTPAGQDLFDEDLAELGYVMNTSRLWGYQPDTVTALFGLARGASAGHGLSVRQRLILGVACTSAFGDSYCALAWGGKLAGAGGALTAVAVLRGDDELLSPGERAMAGWARAVARDPNATTAADVRVLRDAGFSDAHIFAMTAFVALRLAFSTVNDALGLRPDAALRRTLPPEVLDAVTHGRPIDVETS